MHSRIVRKRLKERNDEGRKFMYTLSLLGADTLAFDRSIYRQIDKHKKFSISRIPL